MFQPQNRLLKTYQALCQGRLSRREFIARAAAAGIGAPVALMLINSVKPDAVGAEDAASGRPSMGTEGQVRGASGELRILTWLPPTVVNMFMAQSLGDLNAASLVQEPLLSYAPDGSLLPTLAAEVPGKANGGLSDDLRVVTLTLREGVRWSDGEPFTAEDVVWTRQWFIEEMTPNGEPTARDPVESVGALSPLQVRYTFREPRLAWYERIAGTYWGAILPKHVWDGQDRAAVNEAFLSRPIGTGPFKIDSIVPGDRVVYSINEHYREPNKPYFSSVILQGGGDELSVAQAVLQTGEGDVGWPLLAGYEAEVLREMESAGGTGVLSGGPPVTVERIAINFSDPNTEVDGERSSLRAPHPILSDLAVRRALALAIDREAIANQFFMGGDQEPPAVNILTGIGAVESPNTSWEYDIEGAKQLLDEAGWVREGERRVKDGVELLLSYNTTILPLRQKIQQVVKRTWEEIGVKVQVDSVERDFFFDPEAPDSENTFFHFYSDVQMYSSAPGQPLPLDYMQRWYAGPDNINIPQRANDWSGMFGPGDPGSNVQRYVNPEYDKLYEEASTTTDAEQVAELFIQMNDTVVNEVVVIPLVARTEQVHAISNRLRKENVAASAWEMLCWNIANWTTVEH